MRASMLLFSGALLFLTTGILPAETWEIASPDTGQTFAYGSERHRAWFAQGSHLAIAMEFTNDPYVDQVNFRQFDDLNFNFPEVRLGPDGRTFFYHPAGGKRVAVARRHPGLFGGVTLLPSASLDVTNRHGFLRLALFISN